MMGRFAFIVPALALLLLCLVTPVSAANDPGSAGPNPLENLMNWFGSFSGLQSPGNTNEPGTTLAENPGAGADDMPGAVTITADGDQSGYFGETIRFSGTNTRSRTTYLFLTGPNLKPEGAQINSTDPRQYGVIDNDAATFPSAAVSPDGSWSWSWRTKSIPLDAGTYTVYAVSEPRNLSSCQLPQVSCSSLSIILKNPFVSGTLLPSTIKPGESLTVSGIATGNPEPGVAIWILGTEYFNRVVVPVSPDASYSFVLTNETTRSLTEGEYAIIVQHPSIDNRFSVDLDPADPAYVLDLGSDPGYRAFRIQGRGSLTGNDAAEALVQLFQSPLVDDRYTKLRFFVSESGTKKPLAVKNGITIGPVDERDPDSIVITAATDLPLGEDVSVSVYPSSFAPCVSGGSGPDSCYSANQFGAYGVVKVTGGKNGSNQTTVDLRSPFFHLPDDEYEVSEVALNQYAVGSAFFNVKRP